MTEISHPNVPIETLRAWLTGDVIVPGDQRYDDARSVFAPGIDRRPAVVVRPVDAVEVAFVVVLAKLTGSPLAVRSGGHSSAGHSVCDGGIVLDLGRLRTLEIDPGRRIAWAGAGLTAREVVERRSCRVQTEHETVSAPKLNTIAPRQLLCPYDSMIIVSAHERSATSDVSIFPD